MLIQEIQVNKVFSLHLLFNSIEISDILSWKLHYYIFVLNNGDSRKGRQRRKEKSLISSCNQIQFTVQVTAISYVQVVATTYSVIATKT